MQLDVWDCTPVELETRADRVNFGWSSIDGPKDIGLVVAEIHGRRIVRLKGRASLRVES